LFTLFSSGVKTNRDAWVVNFGEDALRENISRTVHFYNSEVDRAKRVTLTSGPKAKTEVTYSDKEISWSDDLKDSVRRGIHANFASEQIRKVHYRPFVRQKLFFDRIFNNRVYLLPQLFPDWKSEQENVGIWVKVGADWPFFILAVDGLVDVMPQGGSQLFSFYSYAEDGTNRRENITDWALAEFRTHYADDKITKWDIFHATYAVLHHPEYRTRYAANLKRELPRIPFPPDFHAFAAAGKRLMELHLDYEKQPEHPLEQIEDPKAEVGFRVERMKLSKDKSELRYNDFLLLRGIPAAAFDYRLGNRSALEWVIDQYRVSTDPRSGIVNDPNREDDHKYILRLIGQVITVSLETQQIIATLPSLNFPTAP
jgi:predicted helicase